MISRDVSPERLPVVSQSRNDEWAVGMVAHELFSKVCGLKNVDFRLKNVDFLLKNLDFLLKNLDFSHKTRVAIASRWMTWSIHRAMPMRVTQTMASLSAS